AGLGRTRTDRGPRAGRRGGEGGARVRAGQFRTRRLPAALGRAAGAGRRGRNGGGDMKIALVSEHASPLATMGGEDAGGQNVHVAQLAAGLTRQGHEVSVYTRRDRPDLPDYIASPDGYEVVHVEAGPVERVPKDRLLPHMEDFARRLRALWDAEPPDIAQDRKSTRLNSSHVKISYAVFC